MVRDFYEFFYILILCSKSIIRMGWHEGERFSLIPKQSLNVDMLGGLDERQTTKKMRMACSSISHWLKIRALKQYRY